MNNLQTNSPGIFYGIGVGPGDPELITLKAHRIIQTVPVVSYLVNAKGYSLAREIARESLAVATDDQIELPITMLMCKDRAIANQAYDNAAQLIRTNLDEGKDVSFLCEGDPLLFGSFAYILDRLVDKYAVKVVPGITSISAAASAAGRAFGRLAENIAILSGRHSDERILEVLSTTENVAIMKPGVQRPRILRLLEDAGRLHDACYLEYVSQKEQKVIHDVRLLEKQSGPYFSIFLVTPQNCVRDN